MSELDAVPPIACPNCRQPMQRESLEQNYHGAVRVEMCFGCAGMWFDPSGSLQLAPAAVLQLFKEIHAREKDPRRPAAAELICPRCQGVLKAGFDLSKSGRFSYFSCSRGHGRYTPFLQFLREKQFVRDLTAQELQRVRSQVRQITCSECGAPIDLEHSTKCQYCQAPISFIDPQAVEKAMHVWSEADHLRRGPATAQAVGETLLKIRSPAAAQPSSTGPGFALDLVAMGIGAIARLLTRED